MVFKVVLHVPTCEIVRRYAANLWRTSPITPAGGLKDPFNDAMNEGRVVFAGNQGTINAIQNTINLDYHYSDHNPILRMMEEDAELDTTHSLKRAFEKVFA